MRGDQGEAPSAEVVLEKPDEERLPGVVEGGEGLVEHPQLRRVERQPCEADAAALPGRQAACGSRRRLASPTEARASSRAAAVTAAPRSRRR